MDRTPIVYCYCCGRPLHDDRKNESLVRIRFLGEAVCRQCLDAIVPAKIRCYSMAQFNPSLHRFDKAVQAGKLDIGLQVRIVRPDGCEQYGMSKVKADRVTF